MRQNLLTTRCAWCGRIRYGEKWHAERRKAGIRYTHGICPACRKGFFPKVKDPAPAPRPGRARWGVLRVVVSFVALLATRWFKLRA